MEFEVVTVRKAGILIPRHVLWSAVVRGHLCVSERHDAELNRITRVATIEQGDPHKVLLGPMLDAALVSARPDLWTMTGWERVADDKASHSRACVQSWILIPADAAEQERARSALSAQLGNQEHRDAQLAAADLAAKAIGKLHR